MRSSEPSDGSVAVLTASVGAVRIGMPAARVRGVATVVCSPALPWSPPWWPGVTLLDGQAVWVLDLVGLLRQQSAGSREVTVITTSAAPWAVAITATGALTRALSASGDHAGSVIKGPTAWWRPCRFIDGGSGALIEADVITARLAADVRIAS